MAATIKQFMIFFLIGAVASCFAFAHAAPAYSTNVHILKNVSPSQCTASWRGNAQQANNTPPKLTASGIPRQGMSYQSCNGCRFDKASQDCVCQVCYGL